MLSTKTRLRDLLIKHEGLKLKPYKCTAGKITIGVGRNLDDIGISLDEAYLLLANDMQRVEQEAVKNFLWYNSLNVVRQDVILSMLFNLGVTRLKEFSKMNAAINAGNFELASDEMLNSSWAKQVGTRAIELSKMMRFGIYL